MRPPSAMAPYFGLRGSSLRRAIVYLVVCPAFITYGYNLSVTGGLLTLESFVETFPQLDTLNTKGAEQHHNSTMQGTVVALFTIGGIFGSLSCIYLGDLLGRRRVILIASAVTIIGALLMTTSFDLPQLIVARVILGLGTGAYLATVPVWQAEISKASKRGANVVTDGIFIGAGVALGLWVDFGFFFVKGSSVSWRFPLGFQIVPLLMALVFILFFPESPRWLVKKGRVEEARQILAALDDLDPGSESIKQEIRDIELSLSQCGTLSWKAMLSMGEQRLFHRTVLAATGQIFQQMCGINLISMYATTIFEQYLGLSPRTFAVAVRHPVVEGHAINGRAAAIPPNSPGRHGTNFPANVRHQLDLHPLGGFLAYFTIDRLGRRVLMLWSAAGMSVCMAVLAGTTSSVGNQTALVVAVIALYFFQFIYTVGYSGLTFLYATEVAPLQLRAAISAVSTAAVWTFNFLLAEITPVGFNTIGYRYYIIFAILNAAIVPSVYFFFPETNGRSLEEIDGIFQESKSIWDPPRIARNLPKMSTAQPVDISVHSEGNKDLL
ncbi:hypothetical protein O988_05101 [Pseudogymnoascus sp. VKM F-3808]|nr:hypothetical protein O988_05101 [Pseudogymnoascus sp. VKM F-3808]